MKSRGLIPAHFTWQTQIIASTPLQLLLLLWLLLLLIYTPINLRFVIWNKEYKDNKCMRFRISPACPGFFSVYMGWEWLRREVTEIITKKHKMADFTQFFRIPVASAPKIPALPGPLLRVKQIKKNCTKSTMEAIVLSHCFVITHIQNLGLTLITSHFNVNLKSKSVLVICMYRDETMDQKCP